MSSVAVNAEGTIEHAGTIVVNPGTIGSAFLEKTDHVIVQKDIVAVEPWFSGRFDNPTYY